MDFIKISFQRIKEDINYLNKEIYNLRKNLEKNNQQLLDFAEILENLLKNKKLILSTQNIEPSTQIRFNSTEKLDFKSLKPQNLTISNGNEGVPTDRQTNRQINRQTQIADNSIEKAADMLNSLDSIKKEIRLKFKRLTEQEMLIFSTIYQLEEEKGHTDYKSLSKHLTLTESSIRDYVGRLIKKGIPVEKIKINNKSIQLKISNNLKKIASLSTLLQLREI